MSDHEETTGNPRSSCHDAEIVSHSSDEGTGYCTCKQCGEPCNPVYASKPEPSTESKLLTDAEVEKISNEVERWMREPEQWRKLLTHRFNALLADRRMRVEREKKVRELLVDATGKGGCVQCGIKRDSQILEVLSLLDSQ